MGRLVLYGRLFDLFFHFELVLGERCLVSVLRGDVSGRLLGTAEGQRGLGGLGQVEVYRRSSGD